jgi:hypothetical protein
MGGRTECESA